MTPASITWRQISVATKMACGARAPVAYGVGDVGLCFKVGGRMRWVEVELDPSDTYTCRLVRMSGATRHVTEEHTDIYCDVLSECVYHMVNK